MPSTLQRTPTSQLEALRRLSYRPGAILATDAGMGSSGITIASFNWRVQADLLKLHLDSLGIASWLTDEHVVGVDPLMAVAVGGIKVTVAAEDERAAREALAEFEKLREAGAGDVCLSCGAPMRESDDKCPSCGWSFNDQQ